MIHGITLFLLTDIGILNSSLFNICSRKGWWRILYLCLSLGQDCNPIIKTESFAICTIEPGPKVVIIWLGLKEPGLSAYTKESSVNLYPFLY